MKNSRLFIALLTIASFTASPAQARVHRVYHANHATPAHKKAVAPVSHEHGLQVLSSSALVIDQKSGKPLFSKSPDEQRPIASITKLMTAMVVLDAKLPMHEAISIEPEDMDLLRGSNSRLQIGTTLSRREMLQLALMSSENRAAAALARNYPGGTKAFVAAMNRKAKQLGMVNSYFVDPTGLHTENVSTARDLAKLVRAGYAYPTIRAITTTASYEVAIRGERVVEFRNTNALVRNKNWQIGLSKTGYINEAGRCLVMQAHIARRPTIIVLLDSYGKNTRIGDANRIKKWLETEAPAYTARGRSNANDS